MKIFRLDPIENRFNDAAWKSSKIQEQCWIQAADENAARLRAGQITLAAIERREGYETPDSPWLDAELTSCVEDDPQRDVRQGILHTVSGRTYS